LILKRGVFKLLMTIGMVILTGMKKFFLSQAQQFLNRKMDGSRHPV